MIVFYNFVLCPPEKLLKSRNGDPNFLGWAYGKWRLREKRDQKF